MDNALEGVDYIHCMTPFSLTRYAVKYAAKHNIPVSAGFHAMAENITANIRMHRLKFLQKFIYKLMYTNIYGKVDGIHYPTAFIRNLFETSVGKSTNGYVISNGVNNNFEQKKVYKPAEMQDKIVITTIGRYSLEKSQQVLIKAIGRSAYRDRIQLILAGQGVREKYYKKLAEKLPVKPVFKVFPRDEIVNVLNFSDLYVHPAEIELEGISCLEAIKCGKLTIVSDSKLSATSGFAAEKQCIFKNGDYKHLASVIDYWIEHPEQKRLVEERYLQSGVRLTEECMTDMDTMIYDIIKTKFSGTRVLRTIPRVIN